MATSWQTTLFGAIAAVGVYLTNQPNSTWLPIVGQGLTVLATFLAGVFHPTVTVGVTK